MRTTKVTRPSATQRQQQLGSGPGRAAAFSRQGRRPPSSTLRYRAPGPLSPSRARSTVECALVGLPKLKQVFSTPGTFKHTTPEPVGRASGRPRWPPGEAHATIYDILGKL